MVYIRTITGESTLQASMLRSEVYKGRHSLVTLAASIAVSVRYRSGVIPSVPSDIYSNSLTRWLHRYGQRMHCGVGLRYEWRHRLKLICCWKGVQITVMCMSICLSTCITSKPQGRTLPNFLFVLHLAMARFSTDGVAIRYVLPVLWMSSYFYNMGSVGQN